VEGTDLAMIMDDNLRKAILQQFKELGFVYVALDLEGYIPGNMNRLLKIEK
jgi:uncharacterized protein